MQKVLVEPRLNKLSEATAIKFLESRGYSIKKEVLGLDCEDVTVTNVQIVDFFYSELNRLLGEGQVLLIKQEDKDLKSIQRYQEKAKRLRISKKKANLYLYDSIKLFFKYRFDKEGSEELKNITPKNITFLLGAGSWIIDKVMNMHQNKLKEYENSEEGMAFKNRIYEEEDTKFLELQAERHKKILNS